MDRNQHYEDVFGVVLLTFLLVVGLLAVVTGVDSCVDDVARRRRYHG